MESIWLIKWKNKPELLWGMWDCWMCLEKISFGKSFTQSDSIVIIHVTDSKQTGHNHRRVLTVYESSLNFPELQRTPFSSALELVWWTWPPRKNLRNLPTPHLARGINNPSLQWGRDEINVREKREWSETMWQDCQRRPVRWRPVVWTSFDSV